jgi:signal peptidase II
MSHEHMRSDLRAGFFEASVVRWLLLAVFLVILDQASKRLVINVLDPFTEIVVLPFFSVVYVLNPGAAFSFLADASGWQRWFFILVSIFAAFVLIWMLRSRRNDRFVSLALSLILAGALGNLVDRLTLGAVIDFISLFWGDFHWPAFNFADSYISIGAAMLIIDGLFRNRVREKEHG